MTDREAWEVYTRCGACHKGFEYPLGSPRRGETPDICMPCFDKRYHFGSSMSMRKSFMFPIPFVEWIGINPCSSINVAGR